MAKSISDLFSSKGRKTPSLDLKNEELQVLSTDFNLFYKPEAEPEVAGMEEFIASLDNFNKNAGTKMVLASEYKEKEENEAKARKEYELNKKKFRDAVKDGTIDKTGNPYYLDMYKELTLNDFANKFADELSKKYGELGVQNDTRDGAFETFYKSQMEAFIKKHELGYFSPTELETGFFKETSSNKAIMENNHRQTQLKLFKKKFDEKVENSVYGVLSKYKLYGHIGNFKSTMEFIANDLNTTMEKLMSVNGDGRGNLELIFKGIEKYVTTTQDYDFAKKVIANLPMLLKSGTTTSENIGWVKKKQDELLTLLINSELSKTSNQNKLKVEQESKERIKTFEWLDANSKEVDLHAWANDKNRTKTEIKAYESWLISEQFDGGKSDNPRVINDIHAMLKAGNYEGAEQLAETSFINGQITKSTLSVMRTTTINNYRNHKDKPIFSTPEYANVIKSIQLFVQQTGNGGDKITATHLVNLLESNQLEWYAENIDDPKYYRDGKFLNNKFKKDFLAEFSNNYEITKSLEVNGKKVFSALNWASSSNFSAIENAFSKVKNEIKIPE
tara:strand:+ start:305 stop:1984 length:1680 start_codon:yes stop_codon:yes gene_type:complete